MFQIEEIFTNGGNKEIWDSYKNRINKRLCELSDSVVSVNFITGSNGESCYIVRKIYNDEREKVEQKYK